MSKLFPGCRALATYLIRVRTPPTQHFPPHRPTLPLSHLTLALLASATATVTTCSNDVPNTPDTSSTDTALTWSHVLQNLKRYRAQHRIPNNFVAPLPPRTLPPPHHNVCQYTIEFPISPRADLFAILAKLTAALQSLSGSGASKILAEETPTRTILRISQHNTFEIEISVPRLQHLNADSRVVVDLFKTHPAEKFIPAEMDTLVRTYALCQPNDDEDFNQIGQLFDGKHSVEKPKSPSNKPRQHKIPPTIYHFDEDNDEVEMKTEETAKRAKVKLQGLGVDVFDGQNSELSWDALAGYDEVKKRIDDTLTLPLRYPDIYENIVRGTRKRFESNLPKAVLYEGPPGCGKTLSAKILASTIGVPFVHVPLETILSKYYGETTRKLADILQTANDLGRCLVFIDECDSVGLSRSSATEVHEVTRRTLSVLLRHIDGMDGPQNTILLAATNHKEDIDPALMSRFDVVVSFPLPDARTRKAVLGLYAKHLPDDDLKCIADMSGGFSGRELLDICEEAERMYAGRIVREGEVNGESGKRLPTLPDYVEAIRRKAPHIIGIDVN